MTSYSPFLDGGVQITAWAELHDLTPMLVLVLDKVDGLDNVRVMQRRRDAEFGGELLNILFFRLIFAAFAEFLKQRLSDTNVLKMTQLSTHLNGIKLLLAAVPLMCEPNDACSPFAYCHLLTHAILLGQTNGAVSGCTPGPSVPLSRV